MKRVIAIVLALAMLLSLTAVAFANGFTPSADKTEIKAGETLAVKYTVDETVEDIMGGEVHLFFDAALFDVDLAATQKANKITGVGFTNTVFGEGAESYVKSSFFFVEESATFTAGDTYATLVVTAKQDITEEKTATFKAVVEDLENSAGELTSDFNLKSTTVTVKPIEGYTVKASSTASVKLGETAQVTLTIGNKDKTTYNAYDMTVTYNTDILEYTGVIQQTTDENLSVVDKNGTLRVTGYGKDKNCGTDNIVLNFTAKATGDGDVTVTAAKVDDKNNAISSNAPDATITTATATITVGGYTVSLGDDFTGDTTTTGDEDYTFTPKDADNYDYAVTVKVGDTDITDQVTKNADGSYTIPKEYITGNITVTGTRTGKTRAVTINGEDTTGAATAQYGKNYTFTVTEETGYTYDVAVTIGGTAYTPTKNDDGTYTIKGADLTGDVTITVTKTSAGMVKIKLTGNAWTLPFVGKQWTDEEVAPGTALSFTVLPMGNVNVANFTMKVNGKATYTVHMGLNTIPASEVTGSEIEIYLNYADPATTTTINFEGSGAEDVVGGTSQAAPNNTDFTFSLNEAAGFTYVVKLGGTVLTAGEDGKYTIPGDQITGTALTVTVTKTAVPTVTYDVKVNEYVKLSDSKSVFLIKATATGLADGNVLTYDGNQMYWSQQYNAYAWLVISDQSLAEVQTAAANKMGNAAGTKTNIANKGDVNLTGATDINDAQLVWNMYNAQYDAFTETVNVQKFLEADMNNDGEVTVADAAAVVAIINPAASVSGN